MSIHKLNIDRACLLRIRRFFSKRITHYDPLEHERPSVKAMDEEYKRFIEKKKKDQDFPEFKITNIDINTFRQYKHKNNPIFSTEFKVFITGIFLFGWVLFAIYMTIRILTPDDFEWVEQERKRIEDAKKKIMSIKEIEKLKGEEQKGESKVIT